MHSALAHSLDWPRPTALRRAWQQPGPPSSGRPRRFARLAGRRRIWLLGSWLIVAFVLGGGARDDVQSLLVLRPLAVLLLAGSLWGLTATHVAAHRFLLALLAAWAMLHLAHLVPLPPSWWQALSGRALIVEIDRAAGLDGVWRPLTMVPHGTRNAVWALAAPAGVLLLGIQVSSRDRQKLLPVILALGLVGLVIGGLQLAAPAQSGLFFYRITNPGSPVGLFANRNHQAIFLALLPPMLFAWALLRSGGLPPRGRSEAIPWLCAAGGVLLIVPMILVIGSRSGLMLGLLGIMAAPTLLVGLPGGTASENRGLDRRVRTVALAGLGIAALVLLTIALGRGLAFDRLIASDDSDLRFRVLETLRGMTAAYFPWGSGMGSFAQVYQVHEPRHLLAPVYLNHAHNDWLEQVLTGGLPAVVLLALGAAGFLFRALRLTRPGKVADRDEVLLGRLGLLVLLMLAIASLGDYPLRTPALACLAAVAALWATPTRRNP